MPSPMIVSMAKIPALRNSPIMAKLTAALESETVIALIMGAMDNVATIRDMYGLVSFDGPSQMVEQFLNERFGDYSARVGDTLFLILVTGEKARSAYHVALSIRETVEAITLDSRFPVTMHFAVTHASSTDWQTRDGFSQLLASLEALRDAQRKTNSVWVETAP